VTVTHRVDASRPEAAVIETAASALRGGELVAFATETVYGLGADATQADAVAKIFVAKGRPQTNPLIAHVSSVDMARQWAESWSDAAEALASAFWPGPLTLIVPRPSAIAASVSAGLNTVGLRVPDHAVARALIEAVERPIAAPSANRSEHVSPTTAQHVVDDLAGRIAMVLDSGPTGVGIESTVVDVSGAMPRVLRRGPIDVASLQRVLGEVRVVERHSDGSTAEASPGQSIRHYAPDVPCVRVLDGMAPAEPGDVVLAVGQPLPEGSIGHALSDPETAARELYAVLRRLEQGGARRIVVLMPPETDPWAALRDRLTRATTALLPKNSS